MSRSVKGVLLGWLVAVAVCGLLVGPAGADEVQAAFWPPSPSRDAGKPKDVVVLAGDSRTDPRGAGTARAIDTWPYVLAQIDPFFAGALKFNFAVRSFTAKKILEQFDKGLFEAPVQTALQTHRDAYLLIWVGINDVTIGGDAPVEIYKNLTVIWGKARGLGYKVVAFTAGQLCPASPVTPPGFPAWRASMDTLNRLIVNDPSQYDYLINPDTLLMNCAITTRVTQLGGDDNARQMQYDGIHPTAMGNLRVAQEVHVLFSRLNRPGGDAATAKLNRP